MAGNSQLWPWLSFIDARAVRRGVPRLYVHIFRRITPAHGRHNQDLSPIGDRRSKTAGEASAFVSNKDIDVLADLALLIHNAVLQSGIALPQGGERIAGSCGVLQRQTSLPIGKAGQVAGYAKGDRHLGLLPARWFASLHGALGHGLLLPGRFARCPSSMGHDRRFHADDWWQTFGNDLPGFAFIARSIEFAAPRAEVNAGGIKRVRGHAIAQHSLKRVLLRQPTGERLPGCARVARAIDAQLALRRAAVFVRLNGDV